MVQLHSKLQLLPCSTKRRQLSWERRITWGQGYRHYQTWTQYDAYSWACARKRWHILPETGIDPSTFHYVKDAILQAVVSILKKRLLCSLSNVSLHTTWWPSQLTMRERSKPMSRISTACEQLRKPSTLGLSQQALNCALSGYREERCTSGVPTPSLTSILLTTTEGPA